MRCRHYVAFLTFGGLIIFSTLSNAILLLRLHALYNRDHKILAFLLVIVAGQFATDLYAAIRVTMGNVRAIIAPPFGLPWPGCFESRFNTRYTLVAWIPPLTVATIFFAMTLFNFIRMVYASNRLGHQRLTDIWRVSPLLTAFVRDGTVFYLILFITLLVAMILSSFVHGPFALAANSWVIAVYSFATSRLILNLREYADRSGTVVTWEQTLSVLVIPNFTGDEDGESTGLPLETLEPR
ncbi:hypothetical protein AX14_011060 [Amanita brunnescens Koide BX004]|nr:hypothetical protein AX14_011060 [Amanita brunnescens Koide BX004]